MSKAGISLEISNKPSLYSLSMPFDSITALKKTISPANSPMNLTNSPCSFMAFVTHKQVSYRSPANIMSIHFGPFYPQPITLTTTRLLPKPNHMLR
jgi:hypothetical protein